MRVRFWGVRGSTPTPHKDNLAYGGNTSCVEVRTEGNEVLILDGGTGIRLLGKALEKEFNGSFIKAHVFFSHFHIDHIQGLPFFTPLYSPKNRFTFYFGGHPDANLVMNTLSGIMANPYFPVDISKLPSKRDYIDLSESEFSVADARVLVRKLNHPQDCFGYRITQGGKVLTYCTDVEHGPQWSADNFKELAQNTDCLIVDAQYTPEEYTAHEGWGHSSWKQAVESGIEANAKQIVLYHHDPSHSDCVIDSILLEAQKLHPNVVAAREGLELGV
jgi:phosphoribosyl 1,2-cyclic phosphodiesterase